MEYALLLWLEFLQQASKNAIGKSNLAGFGFEASHDLPG